MSPFLAPPGLPGHTDLPSLPEMAYLPSATTLSGEDAHFVNKTVVDTLASLEAMCDGRTGLPADTLYENGRRKLETSPTNIGLYLVVLGEAALQGFIPQESADEKARTILSSLQTVPKVRGKLPAWLNSATLKVVDDRISSVANMWYALGLLRTEQNQKMPESVRDLAKLALEEFDISDMYDTEQGAFYGIAKPLDPASSTTALCPENWHYTTEGTERDAMISIYRRLLLRKGLFVKDQRADSTQSQTLLSHGGSMFEPILGAVLLADDRTQSEHDRFSQYVKTHIQLGSVAAKGFWGLSPCLGPDGYREYGLRELATDKDNAYDKNESDVITPHASGLAAEFAPAEAIDNLRRLKEKFPAIYKNGLGFLDSVRISDGVLAPARLSLDQSMMTLGLLRALSQNCHNAASNRQPRFNINSTDLLAVA